jgi:hypothetical protein
MLNESTLVTGLAPQGSQVILQRSEGAYSSPPLDTHAPHGSGNMDPRQPWHPQDGKTAQDHEEHKERVDDNHEIGSQTIDHDGIY